MACTESNIAARMPILSVLLGSAVAYQASAGDSTGKSEVQKAAPAIAADQFDKLRTLIKPKPGGFNDLPWMTDLWEARKKAAAEGKPLFVWVGDGHPLGWT